MSDIPVCYAGSHALASGGLTNVVTVGTDFGGDPAAFPVIAGETVIVCGGAGTHLPASINDSGGNGGYAQAAGTATSPASWIWASPNVAQPLHAAGSGFTADTVTVTYSVTGDGKQAVVMSVPGLLASPVDSGSAATASGNSGSPSVTSGALAQAREFIVAVCVSQQAGGEPVWPAPWQVIATGVQTGAMAYCSVAVARNYTGTAAVTAAPSLPGTPGPWTMSICGFKAKAASLRHWVGATVSTYTFDDRPGSWGAAQEWDADMGRDPSAKRLRVFYYKENVAWAATAGADQQSIATLCPAHPSLKPVACLKPQRMGVITPSVGVSEINGMCTYITMIRNNGVTDLWWALWNEMCYGGGHSSFGDGTTPNDPFNEQANNPWRVGGPVPPPPAGWSNQQAASHYQSYCNLYSPPLLKSGYLIGYKPLIASPIASVLFFPGRAWGTGVQANNTGGCNDVIIDMYASQPFNDPVGQFLFDVDTLTRGTLASYKGQDFRFSPPMGLGLGEIGVTSGTIPDATVPGWTAHMFNNVSATSFGGRALPVPGLIRLLVNRMNAGYPLAPMAWFAEKPPPAGNAIDAQGRLNGRQDIGDAWRAFYDALSVDAVTAGVPPTVSTASLPAGQAGVPYSFALAATGGTAPLTWAVTTGALPAGLTLHPSGRIDGSPASAGVTSIGFTVTDAASLTGTATLTLTVAGSQLAVPAQSLPAGTTGAAYSAQLSATGGTSPDTWAITAGALPAGLSLVPATGGITGTPSGAGTTGFTAQVTDHLGATASRALSITVTAAAFAIITTALPSGETGISYTAQIDTAGGTPPVVTWAVTAGALPPGLSLAIAAPTDLNVGDEAGGLVTDEAAATITNEA